jgi:hypothetical protein
MDVSKLQEAAAAHGVKVGMLKKGLYTMLAQSIPDDAEIEIVAEGLAGPNPVPIVVTEKTVYAMSHKGAFGLNAATISRAKITDVEVSGGLLATLVISVQGKEYAFERMQMPVAQRVAAILA